MAKKGKKVRVRFDLKALVIPFLVILIFLGTYSLVKSLPLESDHATCSSSAECSTGYVCYISRMCPSTLSGAACGPETGDLKCHKVCNSNADCASDETCQYRLLWSGDAGTGIELCIENCESYCMKQPHVMCIGSWNISGEYPACNCQFACNIEAV